MSIGPFEYARRVEQQRDKLYRIAFCYVKNQQDALDIVGEAVFRGLLRLGQLRKQEQFEPWLHRIVVNASLDFLRHRKHDSDCAKEDLQELPAEKTRLPQEEQIDLYEALDSLPPEERSYIILRFFEELSFREMAEILQLPETTVKSRVYRILQKLRKQLSE